MSLDKLAELGLDVDPSGGDDRFTSVDVQGVGGVRSVPIFLIDEYRLTTDEGVDLVWRDSNSEAATLQVIGLDLHPSLDGVIGSDLLTAGLLNISNEIDLENIWDTVFEVGNQPIDQVHMDFRGLYKPDQSGTGTVYFDLNPDHWGGEVVVSNGTDGVDADFNDDGVFDCGDLDGLYVAMESGDLSFDLTNDGTVDGADLSQWRTDVGIARGFRGDVQSGDANLDGAVDRLDLNIVGIHWLTEAGSWCDGDFNHDGEVDRVDLNEIGVAWGNSVRPPGAAAVVPEPTLWIHIWPLLLAFRRRTSRRGF